jgi:hypothetical protein
MRLIFITRREVRVLTDMAYVLTRSHSTSASRHSLGYRAMIPLR